MIKNRSLKMSTKRTIPYNNSEPISYAQNEREQLTYTVLPGYSLQLRVYLETEELVWRVAK